MDRQTRDLGEKINKLFHTLQNDYSTNHSLDKRSEKLTKYISQEFTLKKTTFDIEQRVKKEIEEINKRLTSQQSQLVDHGKRLDIQLFDIESKAPQTDIVELIQELKRFALYEDLKKLYNKTVPPVDIVQKQIQEFRKEH